MPRQTCSRSKSDELGPPDKTEEDFMTRTAFEKILDKKLDSLKEDLASKDDIQGLLGVIKEQQSKINFLESRLVLMEKYVGHLQKTADEQERYQRRLCLRINNVEIKAGEPESGENCLKEVKKIFNELSAKNPRLCNRQSAPHRTSKGKRRQTISSDYNQIYNMASPHDGV